MQFVRELHEKSKSYNRTHTRCWRSAAKGDRRKLKDNENNGSRDAPTTAQPRDADSR